MIPILFLSHPQQECGVHQFGNQIFRALESSERYRFAYREVSSAADIRAAVTEVRPGAVIVNWHESTMPWAQESDFWLLGVPVVGLMHEITEAIGNSTDNSRFDYYITHDPSARFTNPIFFTSGRPILPFELGCEPPRRPTIGSVGFATPGKGFEALVARAHAEFDDCLIRLNIPNSYFCDADGGQARAVAKRCQEIVSKPGVQLQVTHEFLSLNDTLDFLSRNSLNAFFYESQDSRGISSAVDLAIAVGRPIALRRSPMFRHLFDSDSVFVERRSLKQILAEGAEQVSNYRKRWSLSQICRDYESMLDEVLAEYRLADTERVRRQWMARTEGLRGIQNRTVAEGEALLRSLSSQMQATEARLHASEARAHELESRLQASDIRTQEFEACMQASKEQVHELESRLQASEARAHEFEARLQAAEARARQSELTASTANAIAQEKHAKAARARAAADKAKARLREVKATASWRATKPLRVAFKHVSRHLEFIGRRLKRRLVPPRLFVLYNLAIQHGRPWGFAGASASGKLAVWERLLRLGVSRLSQRGRVAQAMLQAPIQGSTKLLRVTSVLGTPGSTPEPHQVSAILSSLRSLCRNSDQGLLRREFSTEERQVMLELEFALHLAKTVSWYSRERPPLVHSANNGDALYVFDARCLQDSSYRDRGVGVHARHVLTALNSIARPTAEIVLLLDPTMDAIDMEVEALCDQQVFSCAEIDISRVKLFVCGSPMTASVATLMPLLLAPHIRRLAIVYDFIPAQFPSGYLRSAVARLRYQARHMALPAYHAFVPISQATELELRDRLAFAETALIANSGVADPLFAEPDSGSVKARALPLRYVIAPTGGDTRKNLLIVIAAEALNRSRRKKANHIVVVGHVTANQKKAALRLGRRSGLSRSDIVFLSGLSNRELKAIYQQALICVIPSFAEGFSIPVAEAVHSGTAVVASNIPAHRELLGAGPWLAEPTSVSDMARAMRTTIRKRQAILQSQGKCLANRAWPDAVRDRITNILNRLLEEPTVHASAALEQPAAKARRPRIAVATPWPPQKSGIADYSLYTMKFVSELVDVTILTNIQQNGGEGARVGGFAFREIDASAYLDPQYDKVLTVLGNSHFHLPGFEYVMALGGAVLAHDNRMTDFYWYLFGPERTSRLLSTIETRVRESDIPTLLADLAQLPSLGYAEIGRVATPLLVHSRSLRDRLRRETARCVLDLLFVPYRRPPVERIDHENRRGARCRRGIDAGLINVATFGIVDRRNKGADLLVEAMAWLSLWNIPARLHYVGAVTGIERGALEVFAREIGISELLVFHDHLSPTEYSDMLLAMDVAVQLRTSAVLTLSGALLDCVAFGVPTITTRAVATDVDAPPFVTAIPDQISPLLLAEAIIANSRLRSNSLAEVEDQRLAYLARRSAKRYASDLLRYLDIGLRTEQ